MTTIKDVAKKAGVAPSTVSKALNNYHNITQETKDKVNQAVADLGYIPNQTAANLSKKKYCKIGLIINVNNSFQAIDEVNMKYLFGAFEAASHLNLEIMIIFSHMISNYNQTQLDRYLRSQNINSLIFYGMNKDNKVYQGIVASLKYYSVIVDYYINNDVTSTIMVDHYQLQYDVAKKTITQANATKVLYLAGNENGYVTKERLVAIKKLEKDLNLKFDYYFGSFLEKKAYEYTLLNQDYDAYICASDLMAIGVNKALWQLKKQAHISGFDGISLLGYVGDKINTVYQDFQKISYEAVQEVNRLNSGCKRQDIIIDGYITLIKYEDIVF
ncbi:MAG: LacI family DNA-binding transcriptional regulator [Bacilli bacterium]